MNLEHLSTFVNVVDLGSLSAAARAQRISQPAVTKQVQRLEAELGLTLLIRGPRRRIELTPAGEAFLAFARETLSGMEALQQELAALREVSRGTLRLAASTIPGEHVLPGMILSFRTDYPHVAVRMSISDSSEVAVKLRANEADVGVIGSQIGQPGIRLEHLVSDEIILAVPPQHILAGQKTVTLDELRHHPIILREQGSGTRRTVEEALKSVGKRLPAVHAALILGSSQAVVQAVAQGLGVGFVSARACLRAQPDGHVTCVRLEGVDLYRSLYLAYKPQRVGEPVIGRFLDFARTWARQLASGAAGPG